MTELTLRLAFATGRRLGPGKIRLLEEIGRVGSIAGAGRGLGMSYRRAWTLVDEVNGMFDQPAVVTRPGGSRGGGADLTDWGNALVALYRRAETEARRAISNEIATIEGHLAPMLAPAEGLDQASTNSSPGDPT